jgi:hypothetical protein
MLASSLLYSIISSSPARPVPTSDASFVLRLEDRVQEEQLLVATPRPVVVRTHLRPTHSPNLPMHPPRQDGLQVFGQVWD